MESYKKGTFWERVFAALLDQLIVLLFVGGLIFLFLQPKSGVLNTILFILLICYGTFFLWKTGSTPGKKMLRLKVVDTNYETITLPRALLRESIGKFVSSLLCNLGYFWVLLNPKRQAWHDMIAKTYVVKTNKAGEIIPLDKKEQITKADKVIFGISYFVFAIPIFLATTLLFVSTYLLQPFTIEGGAMVPSYVSGQKYLINKIIYRVTKPHRGDVVVLTAPNDPNRMYTKRIIGMPQETIALLNGAVFINGKALDEQGYLPKGTITMGDTSLQDGTKLIIPANSYFVLGDNRVDSSDSRNWGVVPKQNIIGKMQFCFEACEVTE